MDEKKCIFCKLIKGEIPSTALYEDDLVYAFEDINPVAPVHFLIIPKEHIPTLDDTEEKHEKLLGHMVNTGVRLAREKGVSQEGYRLITNCREYGGQEVFHLHMHIIGGARLGSMIRLYDS